MAITDLPEYVERFRQRVLQDALAEGTRQYWLQRAETFEAARPTASDYPGTAGPEGARRRWDQLTEIAKACRNRAILAVTQDDAPWV